MDEPLYSIGLHGVRWKRSALKGVDPESFEIIGDRYGRDAKNAYFRAKRVRLKKKGGGTVGGFREIGPSFATDGGWLYHGTKQITPPDAAVDGSFDLSVAKFRPFHGDLGHMEGVNLDSGVLSDGTRHFACHFLGGWYEVPSAEVAPLEPELEGFGHGLYVSDRDFHTFRGVEVEGARGRVARALAPAVLAVGEQVFIGAKPFPGRRAAELCWITGDLLHAGDAILVVDGRKGGLESEAPVVAPQDLESAARGLLDVVLPCMAHVLDTCIPLISNLRDLELADVSVQGPFPYELICATATELAIEVDGVELTVAPDGWYELACRAWSQARGGIDRLIAFVTFDTMLPDTGALVDRIARATQVEMTAYASSLWRAGAVEPARILTHSALVRPWRKDNREPGLFAHLVPELSPYARYATRQDSYAATTNLAVVKRICGEGLLADPDPRVRLEMIDILLGATLASMRGEKTLPLTVPALIERLDGEECATLRTALAIALDACTVKATVMGEGRDVTAYEELERACRRLVADGVNSYYNRVRLFEALWGQGRDSEAEQVATELIAEAPDDQPCPGAYVYRDVFPTFAEAIEGARERATRDCG